VRHAGEHESSTLADSGGRSVGRRS
jgi:hypothetical protein